MTENHFRSHFSSFQINTNFNFFHKIAASGHFGWPKITFDCIFRHFRSIHNFFFSQNGCSGHFGWPKISFDRIFRHFRSIRNFYIFVHKMAAGGHFGWPKIDFDHISRHFRSIRNFHFFSQNGCQRPFWMTENQFLSHFSPFQINTQLWFFFFHKMAAGGFQSHFSPFQINTQLLFFFKFLQNGCRWPFWMNENHFRMHFSPFQINTQLFFLNFFFKMATGGHIGSSIWPILDDRKLLSIAFLAISDQYTTFFCLKFVSK